MTGIDLGKSLVDLGKRIQGGDPVDPLQLGNILVHVGLNVERMERRLSDLEARLEAQ